MGAVQRPIYLMTNSELKLRITEAMKDAMRARDQTRLGTIRLMLSELKRIEVDERVELDDQRVIAILDKMLKQRRDSVSQFRAGGREAEIEEVFRRILHDDPATTFDQVEIACASPDYLVLL